ncbi:MAG: tRNA (adenosine(37)-N6)-threonylcarbamoyltransferase complex ATPase subunit type 1 TsaE [Lachnospiraceae bacterium]|nr:tRNA (adenosine(37)-N6)-threonylcarbamoyltransferase complex ATPase subunit type 1 TsaE [Lachnospiraceae bacterium]
MEPKIFESNNNEETFIIGKNIGLQAKSGDVITLIGDLGCGKTVLAKGIAVGLGIDELISSPTFVILHQYDSGRIPLNHFDVYRISDIREMDETGYYEYIYGDGITLIEWADLIEEILPAEYIKIEIRKDSDKGFDYRLITVSEITQI